VISIRGKVVGALAFAILLASPAAAGAVKTSPGQIACNGSSTLCERKLNEVVLPGSHNSMSAEELGWILPNQTYPIPKQLELGARAMLVDIYYGNQLPDGRIGNLSKSQGRETGARLYLCHVLCLIGASELVPVLEDVADFLRANPNEVLVFINQDSVDPDDFAKAVEEAGLLDFIYTGPAGPWPTLGEMVSSNQRVVMLAESDAGSVSWYHEAYDGPVRETPYSFNSDPALLTDPALLNESCRSLRGEGSANSDSLFLMNHWISTVINPPAPNIANAELVNRQSALVERARACEQRRGFLPSILAVDFYGTGDVVGATNELNGVASMPMLRSGKVANARVRAGRRAVIRVPVRNAGDAAASSVKVCAKVPRRLASKPRCLELNELQAGSKASFRLRLATKKKARGKGTVRIKVRSSAGTYTVKTRLKVKAAPRKRRG